MNRRRFLQRSAQVAAGLWLTGCRTTPRRASANDKLNLGVIGVANRGRENLNGVAGENIVALCDVDDDFLMAAARRFPQARTYHDFRHLLERNDLDAVVISTPDHTHAVAAAAALRRGRHVYCEKPLTRTISECRIVTDLARKQRLITQIGTQIHAGQNYPRVVAKIQQGEIGAVQEVHVWVNATYGGQDLPRETPAVPANLHYDLWLGPLPFRPYHPDIVPRWWRHWWAFGGGALADFGCHYLDLPHWALGLRAPSNVEVVDGPPVHRESTPPWLVVRYEYPASKESRKLNSSPRSGPTTLTWYHGGRKPAVLPASLAKSWPSGVLFVGATGLLLADYTRHTVIHQADFSDYAVPPALPGDFARHHQEWIQAVKTGKPASCDFAYSGPLTEAALLGNVAFRVGQKLDWDARNLRARNCPAADEFIRHQYRAGWTL